MVSSTDRFSEKSLLSLGDYYVYGLIDPRTKQIVYIGKGTKNRVFEHEKELNEMGLAIPQVTQLMHRLKSEGYPVFENAITVQEARKNLLIYFQGKKKQDCKSKDQNNQDQKSQIESRRKPEGKTV